MALTGFPIKFPDREIHEFQTSLSASELTERKKEEIVLFVTIKKGSMSKRILHSVPKGTLWVTLQNNLEKLAPMWFTESHAKRASFPTWDFLEAQYYTLSWPGLLEDPHDLFSTHKKLGNNIVVISPTKTPITVKNFHLQSHLMLLIHLPEPPVFSLKHRWHYLREPVRAFKGLPVTDEDYRRATVIEFTPNDEKQATEAFLLSLARKMYTHNRRVSIRPEEKITLLDEVDHVLSEGTLETHLRQHYISYPLYPVMDLFFDLEKPREPSGCGECIII